MPASKPITAVFQFEADAYAVRGPLTDGGYKITLSVGEYQQANVAKLLTISQQTILNVTVEVSS
jgi:hypothetical protein